MYPATQPHAFQASVGPAFLEKERNVFDAVALLPSGLFCDCAADVLTFERETFAKFNTFTRFNNVLLRYTVKSGYISMPMNERITHVIFPVTVTGATELPRVVVCCAHHRNALQ